MHHEPSLHDAAFLPPRRNGKEEQIHSLFNRLHRAVGELNDAMASTDSPNPLYGIAKQIDEAHHDFTNKTTGEVID